VRACGSVVNQMAFIFMLNPLQIQTTGKDYNLEKGENQ